MPTTITATSHAVTSSAPGYPLELKQATFSFHLALMQVASVKGQRDHVILWNHNFMLIFKVFVTSKNILLFLQ